MQRKVFVFLPFCVEGALRFFWVAASDCIECLQHWIGSWRPILQKVQPFGLDRQKTAQQENAERALLFWTSWLKMSKWLNHKKAKRCATSEKNVFIYHVTSRQLPGWPLGSWACSSTCLAGEADFLTQIVADQDGLCSKARQTFQDEMRFEVWKAHRPGWTLDYTRLRTFWINSDAGNLRCSWGTLAAILGLNSNEPSIGIELCQGRPAEDWASLGHARMLLRKECMLILRFIKHCENGISDPRMELSRVSRRNLMQYCFLARCQQCGQERQVHVLFACAGTRKSAALLLASKIIFAKLLGKNHWVYVSWAERAHIVDTLHEIEHFCHHQRWLSQPDNKKWECQHQQLIRKIHQLSYWTKRNAHPAWPKIAGCLDGGLTEVRQDLPTWTKMVKHTNAKRRSTCGGYGTTYSSNHLLCEGLFDQAAHLLNENAGVVR